MSTALPNYSWEQTLLTRAYEALQAGVAMVQESIVDNVLLDCAYAYCTSLTAAYSRSFYLASSFLPFEKRRAMRALYAFCRVSDNIVDCPEGEQAGDDDRFRVEKCLEAWRQNVLSTETPVGLVALAWADTRLRYQIPYRYSEQLLDGVGCDLHQTRYQTFENLAAYAYGVAATVGLMSMYIVGFKSVDAIPYAIRLGVALQLTNILRDIGEDWRAGRVYLPAEELDTFGLSEADLAAGRVDERWRKFMRFQIQRNRSLYAGAWPGLALLDGDGRLAVAAAAEFYQAILSDIETHGYDVFHRRAHVSALGKLWRFPGIWRRSRGSSWRSL